MREGTSQTDFAGIKPVAQFLDEFMGTGYPDTLDQTVKKASATLRAVGKGDAIKKPLLAYLAKVSPQLPGKTKPRFFDTSAKALPSQNEGQPYTTPDIMATKPWVTQISPRGLRWWHAATIIELKYKIDIFDSEDQIINSFNARETLAQLSGTARNILVESTFCHVYVVVVFSPQCARIFRFDRSGFCATTSFDLIAEPTHLPIFLWRLYNPKNGSYLLGADDTITFPSSEERKMMYAVIRRHEFYRQWSFEQATKDSLWIQAIHYEDGSREPQVVNCFTFGGIIAESDGLFSRATRVWRVILGDDVDAAGPPTVYALKDAWPKTGSRPEVNFYDMIAKYCADEVAKDPENEHKRRTLESIAKCHGSVNLSAIDSGLDCDHDLHLCRPGSVEVSRCHTRLLLTPVGMRLENFQTTKSLVQAVLSGIVHHRVAYQAGVLHRDISHGNILYREVPHPDPHPEFHGFLVDWDNAGFTKEGVANFNEWFPDRTPVNYEQAQKSLTYVTGTLPFLPIDFIRQNDQEPVAHGPHHDLESFYWLLVWMVLRHTSLNTGPSWQTLFDPENDLIKKGWVLDKTPLPEAANRPLYVLFERLRHGVYRQNGYPLDRPFIPLTHARVIDLIDEVLYSSEWPDEGNETRGELTHTVPQPRADEGDGHHADAATSGGTMDDDDVQVRSPRKRTANATRSIVDRKSGAKRRKRT